eukprot:COSAG02_NODE_2696_length_8213_cov_87.332388_6_plen_86_part_00
MREGRGFLFPNCVPNLEPFSVNYCTICDDFFNKEAWIHNDAAGLLGIEGLKVTGDGSETACDVNVELAIAQRRISSDFYLASDPR